MQRCAYLPQFQNFLHYTNALNEESLYSKLQKLASEEILRFCWETYGNAAFASSSFQSSSLPLLHLISLVCSEMPVYFIDTGFHFSETLEFRDRITKSLSLNLKIVYPEISKNELLGRHGEYLYRRDPDLCCYINKVSPMSKIADSRKIWISGLRKDQTLHRSTLKLVEAQPNGLQKVFPLLHWSKKKTEDYMAQNNLPFHPLHHHGFKSIGCAPCTRPVDSNEDERAGRWGGMQKTECGLHKRIKTRKGVK
ncbi:MAG: phosphoadenylyl-sulfate reductase [Chitinivibrionales bacterium]|nr:phosphoadenylyl-sulfate reductase [Chitinivibrionales bacterium]